MKRTGAIVTFLFLCAGGVAAWGAGVDLPYRFRANTVAVAAEVNANFDAVEAAIDDNDDRLSSLEADVFPLGRALQFLPQSDAAAELADIAALGYDAVLIQFSSGLAKAEEVCGWSQRWSDSDYLASADDPARLSALADHADRMLDLRNDARLRFDVGLGPFSEVLLADYCLLDADTIVEGFAAKAGL
jgi:hypothetical protein